MSRGRCFISPFLVCLFFALCAHFGLQSRDALRALRQRCTPSRNPPVASPGCLSPSALPSPRTPSATLALRPSRVSPSRGLSRSPDPSPLRARAPAERAGRQVAPAGPQAGKASRESPRTPSSAVAALARDARPAVKTLLVAPRTAARDLSRGLRRGAPPASAASSCGAASGHGSATAETPRKGGNSRERDKAGAGGDAARRGRVRRSQSLPAGGSSEARSLQGPGSPPPTLSRKRPPRERACCRDLRQAREGRLRSLQAAHDAGATPRRRDPSEFAALAAFLSRHGPPHSQCVACLPSTPSDSPVQASPAALSHERLRPFREATHTTSLALASASSSASPSSPYAYSTRLDGCLACSPSARRRRHEDGADSRRVSPTRARDVREATAAAERAEAVRRREVRAGELKRRRDAQQSLAPSRMEANALEGRPEITCGDTEPPRLSLGRGRVSQGFASEGTSQDAGQRPTALTGLSQEDERRLYKHMPQNLLLLYKSMARRNGAASAETATAEAASYVPSVRCAAREDTREAAVSPSLRKAQPAAGSTSRAAGGEEAEETEDSLRTPRGVLKAEKLRETGRQNCRHASPLRYGGSGAVTLFERRRSCEVEKPVASVRPETSLSRARSLSSSPRARRVTTPAEDGTHRARLLAMRTAGRPLSLCPRTGALAATRQGSRPTAQRHLEASCHSAQTRLSGEAGGLQWTCRAGSPPRGARAGKLCGAETRRAGRGTESGGRLLRDGSSARSRREGATDKKQAEAVTRALQSPVSMNAVEKNAKKLLQRMQHELGRSAPTLLPVQAKLQSLVEQLVAGCSERDDRVRHLVQLLCVSQKAASPPLSPSLCSPRQSGRLAQSRAQAPAAAVARRSTPGVRLSSRHPGGRTTMPAALEASRQWSPMKQNCY
ncbi:hypothetical protein BESB_073420 [Besnoitia besnoiti]|uniref:Uncharacterized protein n=1 Tax=Besnoitia besnoiti TaxID=94643 RepID=A0A2A9MFN0_BESBE|nr:uncharacterized protein BESB_073420 [Besnoitia besnoiti]PFH34190.1 hypothetical protein BESB_073420 [Besnoitia besnoiti]